MNGPEFFLYLPQMRMGVGAITERAMAAEASGFGGIAFMDHLAPPLSESAPMFEAMTLAAWVAARTTDLVVGHLVLCDALRHPAMLARQAVTLDHASGGRFELGLGSGSVPDELVSYGVTVDRADRRVQRLGESLELIEALWGGEPVVHRGESFTVDCAGQQPTPLTRIPIVVGGLGPRTLQLVRRHADWWNLPVHALDRLGELRPQVGSARVSTQHLVGYIPVESQRDQIEGVARRRFGGMTSRLMVGDADELIEHFTGYHRQGVDRFYVWFTDFAPPSTLESFGRKVIGPLTG
ncbi:MAG TPA: LLM class flavin-dependent oxidoreductase [Acidimicrobiales bacterium]|nr:LLM class flavin-dependent oxidoreductase [Acidimicrobiales bacterium]